MRPFRTVYYKDVAKLRLHVYVVGYVPQGESILIVLAEQDSPKLVIVTDCYEDKERINRISNILTTKWNNAPIDLFVWTHPHFDHSFGIPTLLTNHDSNKTARVFGSVNVIDYQNHPEIKPRVVEAFNWLRDRYGKDRENLRFHFVGHDAFSNNQIYSFRIVNAVRLTEQFPLEVIVLGPEGRLSAYYGNFVENYDLNDLSVVYILSVNGIKLFMGGDMTEKLLTFIDDEVFGHIDMIKIPHHASKSAKSLVARLGMNEVPMPDSVSTVYWVGKSDLPEKEVLKAYIDLPSYLHCTDKVSKNDSDNKIANYGCVHIEYNVSESRRIGVQYDGNAMAIDSID